MIHSKRVASVAKRLTLIPSKCWWVTRYPGDETTTTDRLTRRGGGDSSVPSFIRSTKSLNVNFLFSFESIAVENWSERGGIRNFLRYIFGYLNSL